MPDAGLLIGPQRLSRASVERVGVAAQPGVYVLGRLDGPTFVVKFVGRADDLRAALLAHADRKRYKAYIFDYFGVDERAFARECEIYHDFGGWWLLDNRRHPAPPDNADWSCPRCKTVERARARATISQTWAARLVAPAEQLPD